jgi:hypothetical protein
MTVWTLQKWMRRLSRRAIQPAPTSTVERRLVAVTATPRTLIRSLSQGAVETSGAEYALNAALLFNMHLCG